MISYLAIGIAAVASYFGYKKFIAPPVVLQTSPLPNPNPPPPVITVKKSVLDAAQGAAMANDANLIPVQLNGEVWLVAPDYIGPIGIGEAADMAKSLGFELPTPALVDAIWKQADLKLLPMPRNNVVSEAVFNDQKAKIREQIGDRSFTLLGGTFKDIVKQGDGFPGLYGWHVSDEEQPAFEKKYGIKLVKPVTAGIGGKPIQPQSGHAHGLFFKDYSQGLRLVKKMSISTT